MLDVSRRSQEGRRFLNRLRGIEEVLRQVLRGIEEVLRQVLRGIEVHVENVLKMHFFELFLSKLCVFNLIFNYNFRTH